MARPWAIIFKPNLKRNKPSTRRGIEPYRYKTLRLSNETFTTIPEQNRAQLYKLQMLRVQDSGTTHPQAKTLSLQSLSLLATQNYHYQMTTNTINSSNTSRQGLTTTLKSLPRSTVEITGSFTKYQSPTTTLIIDIITNATREPRRNPLLNL